MLNVGKETVFYLTPSTVVDTQTVEASLNLSAESKDKIVSVSGYSVSDEVAIENGFAKCAGKVIFNVVFIGEEPERIETGVKFEFKKPVDERVKNACCEYTLRDFEVKDDGGMLFVRCELSKELTLFYENRVEVVNSVDCLSKTEELSYYKTLITTANMELDDKFEAQRIKKVLYSSADSCVRSVKTGNNSVAVEGFSVICLVSLPFLENSDIVKDTRVIPFKFDFDLDGVTSDFSARAQISTKDLSVKVFTDEEDAKSVIESSLSLNFTLIACGKEKITCVTDAAALTCQLNFKKSTCETSVLSCQRVTSERVFGKAAVDVPEYSRFIKAIAESVEIEKVKTENGELSITGVVRSDCFFAGDNGIVSKNGQLPFNISCDYQGSSALFVRVCAEDLQGRLRSGKLEQEVTLHVSFCEYENTVTDFVCDIEEGEEIETVNSPISVYFGKIGDEEWDVVKTLRVDPSVVYEYNQGVSFPLSEKERIIVLRKEK